MPLDHKTVELLERAVEEAIANAIGKMSRKMLPFFPSCHTTHLMAKAAVAVYEAVVESGQQQSTSQS